MYAALLLAAVLTTETPNAQESLLASQVETLRGITTLAVLVEDIPDFRGLKEQLTNAIEKKLRDNGIEVVPSSNPFVAVLYLNANVMRVRHNRSVTYSIDLEFQRYVTVRVLPAQKDKLICAATWSSGLVGTTPNDPERKVREAVRGLVELFLNDYLAANAMSESLAP